MSQGMHRVAALFALTAILACSGLGVCWRQAVSNGHDCCRSSDAALSAPAAPCASSAESVTVAKVVSPLYGAPRVFADRFGAPAHSTPAAAFASSYGVIPPPLVLRI